MESAWLYGVGLKTYKEKRDFAKTSEPKGKKEKPGRRKAIFVVQEHHARRLHWDFRLEAEGVLKSWAVTKEPTSALRQRVLAIETEDHPLEYAGFHGQIPQGQYGAGKVKIWDKGTFECAGSVVDEMENGKVKVFLKGKRLKGAFDLILIAGSGARSRWLFFKPMPKAVGIKVPDIR